MSPSFWKKLSGQTGNPESFQGALDKMIVPRIKLLLGYRKIGYHHYDKVNNLGCEISRKSPRGLKSY